MRRAKADSNDGRRALADLCEVYYEPVLAFLKCTLRDADAARDMTHEFFAQLLAGGGIAHAEREQGRFRSYLLGAVKHFLSNRREAAQALRRGGGSAHISLDEEASRIGAIPDAIALAPDAAFDRQWALTVLAQALKKLRAEFDAGGKAALFESLKPWLTGDAAHGDQAELAAACGMGVSALKMAIQRLRQRYRDCILDELRGTLEDARMVQEEMQSLMVALTA